MFGWSAIGKSGFMVCSWMTGPASAGRWGRSRLSGTGRLPSSRHPATSGIGRDREEDDRALVGARDHALEPVIGPGVLERRQRQPARCTVAFEDRLVGEVVQLREDVS